jgi:isopentenyl-diphosphate delta-isomerase
MDEIVYVDAQDRPVGVASKTAAHARPGRLHRAFSVMLVDADDRLLLQRRADGKYHFGGLWANSCCGHPGPGEVTSDAAARRTFEELGVRPGGLLACGSFVYEAHDEVSGLVEHELDHVYVGRLDAEPVPDPAEVSSVRRVTPQDLAAELAAAPRTFAPWLPGVLAAVLPEIPRLRGPAGGS